MKTTSIAVALMATFASPAFAASADHSAHHPANEAATPLSSGEVRRVDPDTRKITIRHGPIENLGMPPMTMVFQVSDPALLGNVKAGDKIRFRAEKRPDGAYVATAIEPEK